MNEADEAPVTIAWDEALRVDIERARKSMARSGFLKPAESSAPRPPPRPSAPRAGEDFDGWEPDV